MDDCLFCKIVKGEIPANKIYEDNNFLVFLDINPGSKGHSLLIPKNHETNLLNEKDDLGTKMLIVIKKVCKALKQSLGAEGFNIVSNINSVAGQEVFHTHIHIIPRYDPNEMSFWDPKKTEGEELVLLTEKIIKELE